MTRHNRANAHIVDPGARLRVWTVTARPVNPDGYNMLALAAWAGVRVPAYTAAEAVQVAAAMSGLPRSEWASYWWTPTTHEETTP